ncbi:MAG: usg protein [Bauldia sp.]|nr:usg protein [Bauldia sp.]
MLQFDLSRKWDGYGLTTASILYGMPDHPAVLQTFVWQAYDLAPLFPELRRFLDFWQRELEGPLHSVTVAHKQLVRAGEVRVATTEFQLQ